MHDLLRSFQDEQAALATAHYWLNSAVTRGFPLATLTAASWSLCRDCSRPNKAEVRQGIGAFLLTEKVDVYVYLPTPKAGPHVVLESVVILPALITWAPHEHFGVRVFRHSVYKIIENPAPQQTPTQPDACCSSPRNDLRQEAAYLIIPVS